jgi:phosphate:Na+ symporter
MAYVAERYRLAPSGPPPDGGTPGEPPAYRYEDLEQLHALIFDFYARVLAQGVDEQDALRMEAIIRSSRSIMHSVRNFSTLHADVVEFGRDDNPFLARAHGDFVDRLKRLRDTVVKISVNPADPSLPAETDELFLWVERTDREFILSFSRAVAGGSIREQDVTTILMTNRYFTQAARMILMGARTIIGGVDGSPEGVDAHSDGIG